jgi:serine/threonine protein kinase
MRPDEKNDAVDTDGSADQPTDPADASAFEKTQISPHGVTASEKTHVRPGGITGEPEVTHSSAPQDSGARPNPALLSVGETFGGFVVEAEIARGEMGIVYRVKRVRLNRTEALKVIAPKYSRDPAFHARFEREAMNAAIADHPHVVRVYDAGEIDGLLYIAMQYVDGVDLRQMLASQGRLPVSIAAEITQQIGSALDAAHDNDLIHRDVKPANILITGTAATPHAYLSDFGVSRQVAPLSDLTLPGSVVGTPDYSSPEQHLGQPLDHRSDVYSLGCVLYEMLTGTKPFRGGSVTAVAIAHCEQPAPLVRDTRPELPAAFDSVVAKAMAKDPNDRYQSAGELGAAAIAAGREYLAHEAEDSVDETASTDDTTTRTRDPDESEEPSRIGDPGESEEPTGIRDPGESEEPTGIRDPGESEEPTGIRDSGESEEPTRIATPGSTEDTATRVDTRSERARAESLRAEPAHTEPDDPTPGITPRKSRAEHDQRGGGRPRRGRWIALAILALIAVAVVAVVVIHKGGRTISATVVSPVGVNVRSSPAVEGGNGIGHIAAGTSVTVSCSVTGRDAAAGWDRLHAPYSGGYVAADLLKPKSSVPRCS